MKKNPLNFVVLFGMVTAGSAVNAASIIDSKLLANGTWNCSINGNAQQWKFDGVNGFVMNGEKGKYKISGDKMDLVMGSNAGTIQVRTLSTDKLVFSDSDGTTNCGKASGKANKGNENGGLDGRGPQSTNRLFW